MKSISVAISIDQENSGICIHPIPGARMVQNVVMKLIPEIVDEATMRICPATHNVAPEWAVCDTIYGAYPVQPVSAPCPLKIPENMRSAAAGLSQNASAFNQGKARSCAPICSGTIQFANPAIIGMAARKIIVVPCMVKN